ncbi:hypothetical protein D3C74_383590 [compost metagenome]
MKKKRFYPTCRVCDKLNAEMNCCAIYGELEKSQVDSKETAARCSLKGDYIRYLHATPNKYNYEINVEDQHQEAVELFDERDMFKAKHGFSLEEFINRTFGEIAKNMGIEEQPKQ